MQSGVATFLAFFVVACWFFVIGHQLEWDILDPNRFDVLKGTVAIAYTVSALSLCTAVVFFLSLFVRR